MSKNGKPKKAIGMHVSKGELKQIEAKISTELEPFLDGIRTRHADFELFKQTLSEFKIRIVPAFGITDFIMHDFDKTTEFPAKEEIHLLFAYLGLIESLGNHIVNVIVMLLVANGRDFHIERRYATPRIKHAVSIKAMEEERVPLTTKLNFLKDNGILELASVIDSELRNNIAHLRLTVKKDRIYVKGKPASIVVANSLAKLFTAIGIFTTLIGQLARDTGLIQKKGVISRE